MWYALSGGLLVRYDSEKLSLSHKTQPQRSSNSPTEDINMVGTTRVNLEVESFYKSLTVLA